MNTTTLYSKTNLDVSFAPIIYVNNVADSILFYRQAFHAIELLRRSNDDGSLHVAKLKIGNSLFRLHEETLG